jgi:hypothetical protein
MKKWLRLGIIAVAVIGLATGGLYEYATHVGRGWLNGEATYQGRPTSYWRSSINGWVERFDTPFDADEYLRAQTWEGLISSDAIILQQPRPTLWTRARGCVGLDALQVDNDPPAVLGGDADAEPVLRELEADPAMRPLVERSRRQAQFRARTELLWK